MSTESEKLIAEARDRVINLRDYEPGEYDSDTETAWEESAAMLERLADALEAATESVTTKTEYAIRDDDTGNVVRWGDMNHLADADPKNYPGFTIVSSPAQVWTAVSDA